MNIKADINIHHASPLLAEADRLMTVCNSCRYCEGLCAVFPAMEMRRAFPDGDLNYIANLCHGCGACFTDCQFSPPHEFNVNVPQTLAKLRGATYQFYAWPRSFQKAFQRNGLFIASVAAFAVTVFVAAFVGLHDPAVLFGIHTGPGAFYRLMPHNVMAALFLAVFIYAVAAIVMSLRLFLSDIGETKHALDGTAWFWQAIKDAGKLRYLDGGGAGCVNKDMEKANDNRRIYHHLTFYGFLLCFAATSVATFYHFVLGREAPYVWHDLPVLLGGVGGVGLLIGPAGLFAAKLRQDPQLRDQARFGMDAAFLAMLFLTSLTGLLLLLLRQTPAMGLLLALHLGIVFALFFSMPYGKFMHGLYRFLALVKYCKETHGARRH